MGHDDGTNHPTNQDSVHARGDDNCEKFQHMSLLALSFPRPYSLIDRGGNKGVDCDFGDVEEWWLWHHSRLPLKTIKPCYWRFQPLKAGIITIPTSATSIKHKGENEEEGRLYGGDKDTGSMSRLMRMILKNGCHCINWSLVVSKWT